MSKNKPKPRGVRPEPEGHLLQPEQSGDKWAEPQLGFALVKIVEPGQTAAGLHIPSGGMKNVRFKVLATSGEYVLGGQLIKSKIQVGDYIVPKDGTHFEHHPEMLDKHYCVALQDVYAVLKERAS